ncbi:FAD-dependent oxidoreductase [Desulfosarcina sp.]|uniref:GcvT family protein n=1 Tax=Desulfosarcina sp. TaxID=2027861 RepID=UPI0029A508C7|nr:FAD-dependent oxidoreductase [Desulfosarcina sp.]MDX2453521.1 FAD-dependent oxidoreductase [Desulfosarcina sp.]MDX2491228.1 FAD-dependent oxidoreductase [Desulfosarcina sp.]
MKTQARVVVIGGGVIGVSVAYHLAKYGWKDVVLIEKHELTSGSTWMAAGNCSFFHGNYYCTQVNMKSIEIYQGLEAETGQNVGWHTTGSIRTADNPGRMEELGYAYSMNRCLGLDVSWVTPDKIKAMHPLINTEDLLGGLYWPDDGDVDPNSVTMAMSIGAKKLGAEINTHTQVTGIDRTPADEWLVHTDKGDITCEVVVNAAGLWAPEVAKMVGLEIPSIAGEHTHILFEAIDAVEKRDGYLPLVRDPDRSIYIRQEMDSLILGLYESKVKQWNPKGVPWDYAQTELQPDIDHIADFIENGIYRFPIMGDTGFKHVTDGPITYTPNGDPLVGPAYPLKNFFHACGYSFGITQAGGIGHYLAGWIMNGEPEIDLWPVDSRRYGSYANWAYNHEKIEDTYPRLYAIICPNDWRDAARPNRTAPIYEYQKQAGAVFGDYYGWECPNYFTQAPAENRENPGWKRNNTFNIVDAECKHVMEKAGMVDLSRFAKTRITGSGTEAWLNNLTCQKVPVQDGRIALSPMLDKNGNFKSDMTVTRIKDGEYFCVTASVGKRHDQHWLMENLPTDGSVCMEDVTYKLGCLVIAGPKSREVLAKACYNDVSNEAFPFGTSREIYVGRVKCRVNRMNYVGELGYEIFHPIESQIPVFQALMAAGEAFDLKMFGMYAMDSMRLEKGYLAWKSEMNVHHTPLETNVAWTVKMDKDFIGKAGIEKQKAAGVPRQLVCLVCQAEDADPWGYNPIFNGDQIVGMTSSGGYGHRTDKSIALGYVPPALAAPGTRLEVEVLGKRLAAEVVAMPLYDPKNERMKA